MKFSIKTQYGLRGMACLAQEKEMIALKNISEKENIPFNFLEKIFSELEKNNLVESKRGVGGGYSLARPADKIKVGQIIRALEQNDLNVQCISMSCPLEKDCLLKSFWHKIYNLLNESLDSMTLADLIKWKKYI